MSSSNKRSKDKKNIALLITLVCLVFLLFGVSVVKMGGL